MLIYAHAVRESPHSPPHTSLHLEYTRSNEVLGLRLGLVCALRWTYDARQTKDGYQHGMKSTTKISKPYSVRD